MALDSLIFSLKKACPVIDYTKVPLFLLTASWIAQITLGSWAIVAPTSLFRKISANKATMYSPLTKFPSSSQMKHRSKSPSKATPKFDFVFKTCFTNSFKFESTVGSGWWLGNELSTSQNNRLTSMPSLLKISGAVKQAEALPQSIETFIVFSKLKELTWENDKTQRLFGDDNQSLLDSNSVPKAQQSCEPATVLAWHGSVLETPLVILACRFSCEHSFA